LRGQKGQQCCKDLTHTSSVSYARADACLLVQTSAGPSHGDTSDEDESEDVDNTGAKPLYSTEFMVQSCMDMLNHRPPNPVAVATVATGDDSTEAEKGSADENGSDSADDDDASLESVD